MMTAEPRRRRSRWAVAAFVISTGLGFLGWQMTGSMNDAPGEETMTSSEVPEERVQEAIFAGGCFWCIEAAFELVPGVVEAISGYTGGTVEDPTYEEVSSGTTGHFEAVRVRFDPEQVSYRELLDTFWRHIDPTDPGGQFYDRGSQYRTAIFYVNEEQRALADASKRALEASDVFDEPIVTQILPAQPFYVAEAYHQDYHRTCPVAYTAYSAASGRTAYLDRTWEGYADVSLTPDEQRPWEAFAKPSEEELREMLTPLQYAVTQENRTEMAFRNEYWDDHQEGIYVDVVSGEPLFSSVDKFDSGTGWPSFTRPIEPDSVVTQLDTTAWLGAVEVRSRIADSHLGHRFKDGPPPTGERFCINSAALRFVPRDRLDAEGYGGYVELFE